MNQKYCIIIAGPTAVGKTAVAIQLARHFKTVIISADSRQCYREMKIGVARPSEEELMAVPHYFIASHSIHDAITAASFEQYALQNIEILFQAHDVVILVGGTGLYLKAFSEGLDPIPSVEESTRNKIVKEYEQNGIAWLQQALSEADPEYFRLGEIQNPQRMMRALEVIRQTGRSILSFRSGNKKERDFNQIKIGLELPREQLYLQINQRVDQMMKEGLLDEVQSLLPYQQLNALQTVGYAELFAYLKGDCSLERAVELIRQHSRHYAKRQLTWFKKDTGMKWFTPNHLNEIIAYINQALQN